MRTPRTPKYKINNSFLKLQYDFKLKSIFDKLIKMLLNRITIYTSYTRIYVSFNNSSKTIGKRKIWAIFDVMCTI